MIMGVELDVLAGFLGYVRRIRRVTLERVHRKRTVGLSGWRLR
jgi:hypothetical protein